MFLLNICFSRTLFYFTYLSFIYSCWTSQWFQYLKNKNKSIALYSKPVSYLFQVFLVVSSEKLAWSIQQLQTSCQSFVSLILSLLLLPCPAISLFLAFILTLSPFFDPFSFLHSYLLSHTCSFSHILSCNLSLLLLVSIWLSFSFSHSPTSSIPLSLSFTVAFSLSLFHTHSLLLLCYLLSLSSSLLSLSRVISLVLYSVTLTFGPILFPFPFISLIHFLSSSLILFSFSIVIKHNNVLNKLLAQQRRRRSQP